MLVLNLTKHCPLQNDHFVGGLTVHSIGLYNIIEDLPTNTDNLKLAQNS